LWTRILLIPRANSSVIEQDSNNMLRLPISEGDEHLL
jgi:hypothetical protein